MKCNELMQLYILNYFSEEDFYTWEPLVRHGMVISMVEKTKCNSFIKLNEIIKKIDIEFYLSYYSFNFSNLTDGERNDILAEYNKWIEVYLKVFFDIKNIEDKIKKIGKILLDLYPRKDMLHRKMSDVFMTLTKNKYPDIYYLEFLL